MYLLRICMCIRNTVCWTAHQAITNEVIDLMNKADFSDASAFTITYGKIEYKVLDRTIEV